MFFSEKKVVDARLAWEGKGWHATTTTVNGITTVYVDLNGTCIKLGSYQSFCMEGK